MLKHIYLITGILLFLLTHSIPVFGQTVQIKGQISDENGDPIPGASVLVKGTTIGTAADLDGMYTLNVPEKSTLVFSFIGYESQEVAVGNQTNINVSLVPAVSDLQEVVVVGYGTQRRSDLTGSVSSVKSKEL